MSRFVSVASCVVWCACLSAQGDAAIEEARRVFVAAQRDRDAALSAVRGARRALEGTEQQVRETRRRLHSAEVEERIVRGRGDSLSRAVARLTDEAETIRAMQRNLGDLPDGSKERRELELRIKVFQESLDRNTERYGEQSAQRRTEWAAISETIADAQAGLGDALSRHEAESAKLGEKRRELQAAEQALVTAEEALAAASLRLAPPFLEEVRVRQEGTLVYHARWSVDSELTTVLAEQIAELRSEMRDLEQRLTGVAADQERYRDVLRLADKEIRRLLEQVNYNEMVNAVSAGLARWGAITLAIGDVFQIGKALSAAAAAGMSGARALGQEALTTAAINGITKNFTRLQVWSRLGWRFALNNGNRQIAKTIVEIQARQLAQRKGWRYAGVGYWGYRNMKRGRDGLRGKVYQTPSIANLHRALEKAEKNIRAYQRERDDLDAKMTARHAIDRTISHEMNQAYQRQLNEIADAEGSFWRTIRLGKISSPDTAIAIAEASAGMAYFRSLRTLHLDLYALAQEEEDATSALIEAKRALLDDLVLRRSDAPYRTLSVIKRSDLKVGEGLSGAVALSFSAPLAESPTVVLGRGAIASSPEEDTGGGLPLPGPRQGAVMVRMQGDNASWTGEFGTAPLSKFTGNSDGIPLSVIGEDAAGKELDADPGTDAAMVGTIWKNWEEFRSGRGRGRGGSDTWHVLNLKPSEGTSYCFVIDASSSMKDRMADVKAAAHQFLGRIRPGDEVALWAFFNCDDVRMLQPFSGDTDEVARALDRVAPTGGTPLAKAIRAGGNYLSRHGRFTKKALIVLTDGLESCDGDPMAAAADYRRLVRVLGYGGQPIR